MKNWLRDWALGISIANLLHLSVWSELLYTTKNAPYYMLSPPAAVDYLAAGLNTLILGTFFCLVVQMIRRWCGLLYRAAAKVAFITAVIIAVNIIRFQFTTSFPIGSLITRTFKTGMAIPALVAVLLAAVFTLYFRKYLFRAVIILVLLLTPYALITTSQAFYKAFTMKQPQEQNSQMLNVPKEASNNGPQLVWIIFDELDPTILFEARKPRLYPSAIDDFWFSSIRVNQAISPSHQTLVSIPSLLTATTLVDAIPADSSTLLVTKQNSAEQVSLTKLTNIFARAKAEGIQTSMVGWYHPYCRLIRNDLDHCAWYPVFQTITGQVPLNQKKLSRSMIDQIASIYPFNRRRLHIQAYQNILEDSKKVLQNCSGLVFLHFPIPHPPVIYNRRTEKLTTWQQPSNVSGYIDNVALADRAFRQLRLTLQQRGVWDDTAVIISSDHPWRDAAVSSGKESLYVPFLLKMPHQSDRIKLEDIVFQTVNTADLVLAILKREVNTAEQAVAWIDAHSQKVN